jgi:hypothetical protein
MLPPSCYPLLFALLYVSYPAIPFVVTLFAVRYQRCYPCAFDVMLPFRNVTLPFVVTLDILLPRRLLPRLLTIRCYPYCRLPYERCYPTA